MPCIDLGNWADYCFAGGPNDDGPEQLREGGHGLLMDAPMVGDAAAGRRDCSRGCLLLAVGYRTGRLARPLGQAAGFWPGMRVDAGHCRRSPGATTSCCCCPAVIFVGAWLFEREATEAGRWFAVAAGLADADRRTTR